MGAANSKERQFVPRLLRLRDAPFYLGMDRNRFNCSVRPHITEIPIGEQGVAFDRLELDDWVDQYKSRNGRPGQPKGERLWDAKERQDSINVGESGILTNALTGGEFAKALAQVSLKKLSAT